MIRPCTDSDAETIRATINNSALAYRGTIPSILYREPWMSKDYLEEELSNGVKFYGYFDSDDLNGVMGLQDYDEVTLIRHSYVRTSDRRKGIGTALVQHILQSTETPILVGCLRALTWAIGFYEKHGFSIVSEEERDRLRALYWNLSPEHVANSVVLVDQRWLNRCKSV